MILTRRSFVTTSLSTGAVFACGGFHPASARSYFMNPNCKEMSAWQLRVGKVRLRIPVSYRPHIYQKVPVPVTFWQRTLFGRKYAEDMSIVEYCHKQRANEWIDTDLLSFGEKELQVVIEGIGLNPESEGLSHLSLQPPIASTMLERARWIEGKEKGFLFSGGWLLSKERLLRGGRAMGYLPPHGNSGPIVWPSRFYIKTADGLYVTIDSREFTVRGLKGLKADLKAAELLLNQVVVN
jgi:hypothetical protein